LVEDVVEDVVWAADARAAALVEDVVEDVVWAADAVVVVAAAGAR